MTHRPKTLALLISLIGVAPAAYAKAALAVPEMTALDVVRWTPGLQWQADSDDVLQDKATLALLRRLPVLTDVVPAAPSDSGGVEAQRVAASTDAVDAATWSSFGIDLEAVEPPIAAIAAVDESPQAAPAAPPARRSRLGALAQTVGGKLKAATAAGTTAIVRLSKPVASEVVDEPIADTLIETASASPLPASARVSGACMAPPQAAEPDAVHDDWVSSCLAQAMPQAWTSLSTQRIAARIAQRFPAAVATAHEERGRSAFTPVLRDSAALMDQRREIVVASHKDKVLHQLGAVLQEGPGAAVHRWAQSDDLIVTSEAEKVLQTLLQVSTAGRAAAVHGKRAAHRAARHERHAAAVAAAAPRAEAAVTVLAAELALPASAAEAPSASVMPHGPLAAVDIDLRVAGLPPLAGVPAAPAEAKPFGNGKLALGDATLDRVRGGFVTQGLNISFGIERAVYINGALVTSTRLNVSELGGISAAGSTPSLDAATLALIQSGSGNVVSSGSISPTSIGTVVQNTLDGQNIRNLTVINATVNSLGVLRGLNLQSSLRGAVIDSLRR